MANPQRKAWDVGSRGTWLIINGKRVLIENVDADSGAYRIAAGSNSNAGLVPMPVSPADWGTGEVILSDLYITQVAYHDPYPEPLE